MGGSCPEGKSEVIVWGTKVRGILFWGGGDFMWELPGGSYPRGEVSLNRNHPSHKYDRSP